MQNHEIDRKSGFVIDFEAVLWDDKHELVDYMTF